MKKILIFLSFLLIPPSLKSEHNAIKAQLDLFRGIEKLSPKIIKIALDNGANPLLLDALHKSSGIEKILEKIEKYQKIKPLKYGLFGLNGILILAASIMTGIAIFSPKMELSKYDNPITAKKFFFKNGPLVVSVTSIITYISYSILNKTKNSQEIFIMFMDNIKECNEIPQVLLEYYKNHELPKEIKEHILRFIKEKNKK